MMTEQDAVQLLRLLGQMGVGVWIDGGWGVDALLGQQTRPHNDIDIFIEKQHGPAVIRRLMADGYREEVMEYTLDDHTVWVAADNRTVDLHLFEPRDDGTLYFAGEFFPADMLDGRGVIGGITVNCLTIESQLLYHQGYEHDDEDVHDVLTLCQAFDLPLPQQYQQYIDKKIPPQD